MSLLSLHGKNVHDPVVFDEFFELGEEEAFSPFLTPSSKSWAKNLTLKASILSAFFLLGSFVLSFYPAYQPISYISLIFVYFLAGIPSLIESIEDLMNFDINIDVLMTLAAFSSILIGSGMEGGLLLVLFSISGAMEDAVTSKAKGAISSLKKLSPTRATVVQEDGTIKEISVQDIEVGTKILVKAGQMAPLDGTVIAGMSTVNLVHLTGENFPVPKEVGDEVAAGARNLDGTLTLEVTRTSADSTLARIIELVTQAQESRPKLQQWFSKVSRTYASSIILLSALFALTFPFFLHIPFLGMEGSVYRALAFLIAASPCALIIAIPVAYLSAIGSCARTGILIKGGVTLDALATCHALALDKTGTLTTGDLTCQTIEPLKKDQPYSVDEALAIAYSLEKNAVHPIANAIVNYAQENKITGQTLTQFKSVPGMGLEAETADAKAVAIGRPTYIVEKVSSETANLLNKRVEEIREEGELVTVLMIGGSLYLFHFSDTLRPHMKETIDVLQKKRKMELVMLTGDHQKSAERIAGELGIQNFYADLHPEDKLKHVSELAQTRGLAMVGDGINDAPALARATVGICMGQVGSTSAMDAADVILLQDNIQQLDWLLQKARQTKAIVRQNLTLATVAILVATIPALSGYIPLWLAVVLHEGGTVLVGLNGLRLLKL